MFDDSRRGTRLETFAVQLHRALLHARLPAHAPRPLRLVDVKHWVRRRWPLPPEAAWSMSAWTSEYIADEGWELRPHGVELAAVHRLRNPAHSLLQPLPELVRTEYVDGHAVTFVAVYTSAEHARLPDAKFTSEDELLAWLGAPASCIDLWSLAHLERLEADEASRLWLEDLQREVREPHGTVVE